MTAEYIWHVTLQTGDTRRSPRSEVGDNIVALLAQLAQLLDRALTGERVPVPGQDGWTFSGGATGRCCAVTVYAPAQEGLDVPVVTIGVAGHSRCAADIWQTLHGYDRRVTGPLSTDPATSPRAPWCAALLLPGAAIYPVDVAWIADFERCIAWAWLGWRRQDVTP